MGFVWRQQILSLLLVALGCALLPAATIRAATVAQQPSVAPSLSLSAAATAERNGDDVTAEAEYRALAGSADRATAAAGNLALGRFLERRGRSAEALAPLQAAVNALGSTPDGLRATFLLGEAQADQGQNQAAAASFAAYLAGGGPAAGYAALGRASALQAAGDDAAALAALAAPLQAASVIVRRAALAAASQSLERLGNPAQAAADQQAIVATQPPAPDLATALVEEARLDDLASDNADEVTALQQVIQQYPSTPAAGKALDRLDALGVTLDPFQRAIALFDAGRSDEAQAAFTSVLNASSPGPAAAQATYYLARMADRADQNAAALAGYANAVTLDPSGPIAADALWLRAQLLRYLGRYGEAQTAYASLVQQFPQSGNASDAAFNSGLMAYLDGSPADAATAWSGIAHSGIAADAARADVWLGKLRLLAGDAGGAAPLFAQAETLQPSGYYGLRAELLATGSSVSLAGSATTPPASDWGAVESWLASWAGPEDPASFTTVLTTDDWSEGMELTSLGWASTPRTLLSHALAGVARQPWTLYRAARTLADSGLTDLAAQAAEELLSLAGVQPGGILNAPPALLRLAYPIDYVELVNQDAAQNGLDPLLIDAVMRQESAFNPAAGSSAGAQGLLQLEPSTAEGVATALGLPPLAAGDLKRPLINLQLGASYLAQQAQADANDLSQTLAAYNAGYGNASRWAKQAAGDPDRFYEAVDFSETRAYIRLVSDNYAIDNWLYRGASHPTLRSTQD
jgi:soluble lytic murein transglycosylase